MALAAELAVSGPAACPDANEVGYRVERAIGMPLERAAASRFSVQFEAAPMSYTARLGVQATPGSARSERVLDAKSCAELADAVAVAIALALGSQEAKQGATDAALEATPPSTSSAAEATPPTAVAALATEPDAAPSAEPPNAERTSLTPALAVSLVGDAGSLPGVGLGLGLGAELRARRFALRAGGTLLFDRHVALSGASTPAPGADLSLAFGSLSACTSFLRGATRDAYVCAGWELGRVEAIGTQVQVPRQGQALWSAPRVDLGLGLDIDDGPLRLFGQLTLATPLERDYFYLEGLGTVHRAPAVVGRLALGAEIRFE